MGNRTLFQGLSFGLHEKQKMALLGPNGAGKSTLLKILAGIETYEEGEVSARKNLQLAYVAQEDRFLEKRSVLDEAVAQLRRVGLDENMAQIQASIQLSMAGFEDLEVMTDTLSGGWRKRLSIAIALAKEPDLLLLDEPTNHLDWDGIMWLEDQLKIFEKAFFVVSHDREFLQNQCDEFMEIHSLYKNGYFSLKCDYERFIEKKQEYIESQLNLQESMANKARRETEWLRAGVKARTTKSQSRIKEAHQLLDDLSNVKSRNSAAKARVNIQIEAAGKRSKKFIELNKLSIAYGDKKVLSNLDLVLGPKTCIGLLGENASGKTSLLKVLANAASNYEGEVKFAEGLKIVYFDQKRESLDQTLNIIEYLGDGSDHVTFKGGSVHVASYAAKFLFDSHKLHLPIAKLSGGEQARLLIAKLLLQPADVLLMDEPTNDLDIGSIEILEQSLAAFGGLTVVVSHDRYFLKNLCSQFLALDGKTGWQIYPDVYQWLQNRNTESEPEPSKKSASSPKKKSKVKLSYKEKRRMATIESDIATAEKELEEAQKQMDNQTDFSDHQATQVLLDDLQKKQKVVDELYSFWQNIEEKLNPQG